MQLTLLLYKSAAHGAEFSSRYARNPISRFHTFRAAPRIDSSSSRAEPSNIPSFLPSFWPYFSFIVSGLEEGRPSEKIEIKNGGGATVFLKSNFRKRRGGGGSISLYENDSIVQDRIIEGRKCGKRGGGGKLVCISETVVCIDLITD